MSESPNPEDRRVHKRVPLRMLVQFRTVDLDEFMEKYAGNLSEGGMFICTEKAFEVGSNLYFQFHLADGSSLIEGFGRVVHVNGTDHPTPGMGVEFINMDDESREFIGAIITKRLGELDT